MGVVFRGLIMVTIAICLMSVAANAAQGTSSYYTSPYLPSTCYGNKDSGVMIAKVSDVLWNNQAGCGKKHRVRCIGATHGGRTRRPSWVAASCIKRKTIIFTN
ncbi:hypothetical protein I3842_08G040600 [Carya illinoinensis]|uniref:Uncharacterized protein n=1 Tax=Carya illinoinensis TaxID=32201 RepID=A0A922E8I9_CARIL|nr:hypothetical protein I3842_08G040600 [Carya illinoinensis]